MEGKMMSIMISPKSTKSAPKQAAPQQAQPAVKNETNGQ
jgi:hypothetical protein